MPFGVVSEVGREMGVLDMGGDRRRGRGSFWDEFVASHCNQCGRRRTLPKLLWGRICRTSQNLARTVANGRLETASSWSKMLMCIYA